MAQRKAEVCVQISEALFSFLFLNFTSVFLLSEKNIYFFQIAMTELITFTIHEFIKNLLLKRIIANNSKYTSKINGQWFLEALFS